MSCKCEKGTCRTKTCSCFNASKACSEKCHKGTKNDTCLAIKLKNGFEEKIFEMKIAEVRNELMKRNSLDMMKTTINELKHQLLTILIDEDENEDEKEKENGKEELDIDDDENENKKEKRKKTKLEKKILKLQKKIIEIGANDYEAVLNADSENGKQVTVNSPTNEIKKRYFYLSRLVHPDKLQDKFPKAKAAFQILVTAYEKLSQGIRYQHDKNETSKTTQVSRSNVNCFEVPIKCPRCDVQWGKKIDGVEPIAFTLLMTGLKTYCCSTCLLEFGCCTAIVGCPFCKEPFDYDVNDFQKQVQCQKCSKKFGFYEHFINPKRRKELIEEIKKNAEKRVRKYDRKNDRTTRISKKQQNEIDEKQEHTLEDSEGNEITLNSEEYTFATGLSENCPRCGYSPTDDKYLEIREEHSREKLVDHLVNCNDKKLHKKYQKEKKQKEELQASKKITLEKTRKYPIRCTMEFYWWRKRHSLDVARFK